MIPFLRARKGARAIQRFAFIVGCLLFIGSAERGWALDPNRSFAQYHSGPDRPGAELDLVAEDLVRDSDGFLWLATTRGLARFDGSQLRFYRVGQYPELGSNAPQRLILDSRGRLFVLSAAGISRRTTAGFEIVASAKTIGRPRTLLEAPDGTLWIGSSRGLWRLTSAGIEREPGTQGLSIYSLAWFDSALWAGARGQVLGLRAGGEMLRYPLPAELGRSRVNAFEQFRSRLWAGTDAGVVRFEQGVFELDERDYFRGRRIRSLVADRDGNLWFAGFDTFARLYPDGRFETPELGPSSASVTRLYEDPDGFLWLASSRDGLRWFADSGFRRINQIQGSAIGPVTALARDAQGGSWVGTNHGIARIVGADPAPNDLPAELLEADVVSLLTDSSGRLWAGRRDGRLSVLTEDGVQSIDTGVDGRVVAMLEGPGEVMWLGTTDGLVRWYAGEPRPVPALQDQRITALFFDASGRLWVGSNRGLFRESDDGFVAESLSDSDRSLAVSSVTQLGSGEILIATRDHGIFLGPGAGWQHVDESAGLPTEPLLHVEVRGDNLWLVTAGGLFKGVLQWELPENRPLVAAQPVLAGRPEFTGVPYTACCASESSVAAQLVGALLYVATQDGVVVIDPDAARREQMPPRPYVERVRLADGTSPEFSQGLRLDSTVREFSIDYSAIQMRHGPDVRFRYRLNGFSDSWVDADTDRTARFSNVSAGDFTFELQAAIAPDQWSPFVAEVGISRKPAFTETGFFRLLLVVLVGLLAWLGAWLRLRWLQHQHARLEGAIADRTQQLDDLNQRLSDANQDLQKVSVTDALTGLHNRRYLDGLDRASWAKRQERSGALLLADLDFFKRINDSFGHVAGDSILRQFADVLRTHTRTTDLVARWGGEEFLIVAPGEEAQVTEMLQRICVAVASHSFSLPGGKQVRVTCSVGAVQFPLTKRDGEPDSLYTLLDCADAALYAVKRHGRDGWALVATSQWGSDLPQEGYSEVLSGLVASGAVRWVTSHNGITPDIEETTVTPLRARES